MHPIGTGRAIKESGILMVRLAAILLIAAASHTAFSQMAPVAAAGKPVEVTGSVGQIHIAAGQGMPYFELKQGTETTRVYLGPMPFLIAENVNPKTGQEVTIKGYKLEGEIITAQITFVAEKRTVRFRDDQGWPLWRGGFGRGRGR
jgi:hypothetical protein